MTEASPEPKARRHVLEEYLRKSDLPPLTRLVWHTIATYGTARTGDVVAYPPSLADIAEGSGLSRRAVIDHIGDLVACGWLLRDPGGPGRKTRYRLSSPMDPSPQLVHPSTPTDDPDSAPGRTKVVRGGAPSDLDSAPGRTKVVRGGALDSAPGRTSLVRPGAPDPGIQEIQGIHAPGGAGARSAAPHAGAPPLPGGLGAKARAEANRCEVHRTQLNRAGVCASCRSERVGVA